MRIFWTSLICGVALSGHRSARSLAVQIRYITGRGGRVDRGLSAYLATLTPDYKGLAADSELLSLSIDEQLGRVREFTAGGENLIVNSYGGYLLMLSLIDAHKAPERVLMLSPLLGRSVFPKSMMASRPPREKALKLALAEGRVAKPKYLRIVTGEDDVICCPDLVRSVSQQLEADRLNVIPEKVTTLNQSLCKPRLRVLSASWSFLRK